MTKRRWWLWLWPDGRERMSSSVAASDDFISCTEVQLAPIDAVVCVRGTREWAVVMAMRGGKVAHELRRGEDRGERLRAHEPRSILNHGEDIRWYLLPPPWVPKPDDQVRWYRGEDSGTGWYMRVVETPMYRAPGHLVRIGSKGGEGSFTNFWVERVEPMEEAEG